MNKPQDQTSEDDTKKDGKEKRPADTSSIPSRPEDTNASGDALNGTGEDNHHKQ